MDEWALMLDDTLKDKAEAFCAWRKLLPGEFLGCGVHGSVWVVSDKHNPAPWVLKLHRATDFYERERDCYLRLQSQGVSQVHGFSVPQLLRHDDTWEAVEMSIVRPPFVLDFAGAWLDEPPEFSAEVWAAWEAEKREQFEEEWSQVRRLLSALEHWGIHMMDVHPANVMCR